jgi:hypothetical protein
MKWMLAALLLLTACSKDDKPGQTITTAADQAASATERTAARAADAGARELEREWRNLDIKVESGDRPILGTRDGGLIPERK